MLRSSLLRFPRASTSYVRAVAPARSLSTSLCRRDILSQLEEKIAPREAVEKKRKEMEAKYAEKIKSKIEAEGVPNLDALKEKVAAPSIIARRKAQQYRKEEAERAERLRKEEEEAAAKAKIARENVKEEAKQTARSQAEGDRAGVKPLASIINLPLILMTPHDAKAVSDIWNAYHTMHPTLAGSYLSAALPPATYESMLSVARANPFFVLPLPRPGKDGAEDAFEMFYMQWLFHPAPTGPPLPEAETANGKQKPLPHVTSVIFTPLEEFKTAGEWAQPFLTLTHYPDLSHSHETVLMRGEITPVSASGPPGAPENPGYLLDKQQAQLLALALQRFYCTSIVPPGENEAAKDERLKRAQALKDFREKPEEWDWQGLVRMAFGGLA